jgi:hypothetical protein
MNAFIRTLPGVLEGIDGSDEVRDAFVFAAWRRVSGGQLWERTSPISLEERTLIVAVADNTWKRNLESLAPQLLFKLNRQLGGSIVDFVEFRIAPNEIAVPEESTSKDEGSSEEPPVEISVSARRIHNEQLRETVLKAAANCLSRQR